MRSGEKSVNIRYIGKYGTPCDIGIDGFSNKIDEIKRQYHPVVKHNFPYLCFDKISPPKNPKEFSDKDVFDLFYNGWLQLDKLYYSLISSDYKYCIYRTKLDETINLIEKGEKKFLIHSDLGNGKSVFIGSLENLLCEKGYSIYHYRKFKGTLSREIEQICQSHDKVVVVFEDYVGNIELLKNFSIIYTDQILIMSERTATNEANYYALSNVFGEFIHIDVNLLDANEISRLVDLLDYYGLWHELAANRNEDKESFIRNRCKQRISNVILKLLSSQNIQSRFSNVIDKIKNKKIYYDAILFILIAHISKFSLDMDELSNALGTSTLNTPSFKKDPSVREFIDFENEEIKNKSSIVSEFILSQMLDSSVVVEVMLRIFKQLSNQKTDRASRRILRRMMTFTNVQHIINRRDPNYSSSLIFFYDNLGKIDYCRQNPHYWLQYAIVMLSQYNYPQANAYFENAYAYAKNMDNFDTYQIDNHHARFILENEHEYGTNDTCMEAFEQAHTILMDPKHKNEVRHYPYKVAQNYYPFYEKFYKNMKDGEKKKFINACKEMLERLLWYESTTSNPHRDAKIASHWLKLILTETGNDI